MGNIPVTVRSTGSGGFTTLVSDGIHGGIADEPSALGGLGLGPDPYDLLLMSLGSCTAMTLQFHARRNRWPLETVQVELTHGRVHVEDCAEYDSTEVMIERIERRIALAGPLTTKHKAALMDIAEKCPVHRTLEGRIEIHSSLHDALSPRATESG